MEYFSFEGLYSMNEKLGEVMADMNHELEVLGIIPYNVDERYKMTRDYFKQIGKDFEAEITSPIRTDAAIRYAQSNAKTVFETDVNSHAAADFARLGDELEQRILEMMK
jgi:chromosome partitioning protein